MISKNVLTNMHEIRFQQDNTSSAPLSHWCLLRICFLAPAMRRPYLLPIPENVSGYTSAMKWKVTNGCYNKLVSAFPPNNEQVRFCKFKENFQPGLRHLSKTSHTEHLWELSVEEWTELNWIVRIMTFLMLLYAQRLTSRIKEKHQTVSSFPLVIYRSVRCLIFLSSLIFLTFLRVEPSHHGGRSAGSTGGLVRRMDGT